MPPNNGNAPTAMKWSMVPSNSVDVFTVFTVWGAISIAGCLEGGLASRVDTDCQMENGHVQSSACQHDSHPLNRQPPCPDTNSRHVLLHPRMHRNNLWFAKEHALGVLPGCRLVA